MNQLRRKPQASRNTRSGPRSGRIAFVQSCWHKEIVDQCRDAFIVELERLGSPRSAIDFYEVPGVFEIPLQAKFLARTGRYASIVAAGFVVDGGIYRHEFVGDAVIAALMRVQLDTDVPIISAVLTPPDVISMCSLAIPMLLLYEGSVLTVSMIEKSRARKAASGSST